ncbi:uncharacterized protein LOC123440930 isoform X1 [Hordeum vulgare subsp. vulgare]|uniref:uncharacterized protein LOC123440930 isoform X1 n=1 Tax=Hordeum vulgare subsp. vulgare TaxID=112509 RepID=UPI001D1A596D|nr:uncharacterized protein LOC123440930 isoform X1 [Hordeum vulgare subsp. vulgare]
MCSAVACLHDRSKPGGSAGATPLRLVQQARARASCSLPPIHSGNWQSLPSRPVRGTSSGKDLEPCVRPRTSKFLAYGVRRIGACLASSWRIHSIQPDLGGSCQCQPWRILDSNTMADGSASASLYPRRDLVNLEYDFHGWRFEQAPGPLCGCSYSSLFHSINLLDQHSREESPTVDTDNKSRAPQPTADQHSREVQIDPISWDFHSSGRRDTTGGKQHGSSSCGELQGVNLSQSKHRINGCLRGAEEL